jgi:hypothetical protein
MTVEHLRTGNDKIAAIVKRNRRNQCKFTQRITRDAQTCEKKERSTAD